jgi:hypothetical protein
MGSFLMSIENKTDIIIVSVVTTGNKDNASSSYKQDLKIIQSKFELKISINLLILPKKLLKLNAILKV